MEPLFDKPMSELREAFVRARFAEPNVFGLDDIEDWLMHPHNRISAPGEIAWSAPAFNRHIADALLAEPGLAVKTLATCATPFPEPPYDFIGNSVSVSHFPRDAQLDVLRTLTDGGANVYYGYRALQFPVLILNGNAYVLDHPHGHADAVGLLRLARTSDVWSCIYAEWFAARPKAEKARACLLRYYRAAVKEARQDAEAYFDEAVAVSTNGLHITKADHVLVVGDGSATFFPGEAFRERKIRKWGVNFNTHEPSGSIIYRWDETIVQKARAAPESERLNVFLREVAQWFRDTRNIHTREEGKRQSYARLDSSTIPGIERLLVVAHDDCPSPLPDSGREIQV